MYGWAHTSCRRKTSIAGGIAMVLAGTLIPGAAAHAANCIAKPVSGNVYNIVNEGSGLYLAVTGNSTKDGAAAVQSPAANATGQQWKLTDLGNGSWSVRPMNSGKSLDDINWSTASGAPIEQWTWSGSGNQQWTLTQTGAGSFNIKNSYSSLLATVAGSTAGSNLYQQADSSSAYQRWYLNPVGIACSDSTKTFMGSTKVLIGGAMSDAAAAKAPFDMRYAYLHSKPAPVAACYQNCIAACSAAGWWGCWGTWNGSASGPYVPYWDNLTASATWGGTSRPQIMHWTWYSLRDLSGLPDGPGEVAAINNAALLTAYMNDYRFFLQKIGTARTTIQLEPDFWGYVRSINSNPHAVPAKVSQANPTDCPLAEGSASGLAGCLIKMARKYAPNSQVGLHASDWNFQSNDYAAFAQFMIALGAKSGDFLVMDVSDRDAGWYAKQGQNTFWNDTSFAFIMAFCKNLSEAVGKPIILWQIPVGNMAQNNTTNHYQDNKVQYLFDNIGTVAKSHIVALLFGAGQQEQTSPDTDGGYLTSRALQLWQSGGEAIQ
jgi:Ricin-type beta-trefoil lectin domain-like